MTDNPLYLAFRKEFNAICKYCGKRIKSMGRAALDAHEYVCDELCRHLRDAKDQEELENFCAECKLEAILGIEKSTQQ